MRCVVTGATGLVGGNLAVELIKAGHEVAATRRGKSRVESLAAWPIRWVQADLGEPQALRQAFEGADWVFHCAAAVGIPKEPTPELIAANVQGTLNVLEAVRAAGVRRLMHCSSVVAVGLTENDRPCDENATWNFDKYGLNDGYATTKHWAEQRLHEAAGEQDFVVCNPTYMFGPYDARPSSGRMIVDIAKRKVPGWTPGFNNFVDVRDVARGMIAAMEKGRRGERYILGGEEMRYKEVFERIAAVAGVPAPTIGLPQFLAMGAGYLGDLQEWITGREALINSVGVRYGFSTRFRFSSDKARRELGYAPGPIEPAIEDALAWFRAQKML